VTDPRPGERPPPEPPPPEQPPPEQPPPPDQTPREQPPPATQQPQQPVPPEVVKEPQRLSPLTPFIRGPILLLAFVGASWDNVLVDGDVGFTGFTLLLLLVAGAAYGLASWLVTRYWIDDMELRIDTGVLFRRSRRIRIDRLQGVDIVQPLLARVFGLAELRFDVAGGEREGALAFLPHAQALGLRKILLDRRDDLRDDRPDGTQGEGPPQEQLQERVLARLDLGRLLGSLALSTEMLWVVATVVALAVAFGITGSFAVVGGIVPAVLALALALGRRLTASYGFVVAESTQGLHIRRGLTALSSQTISLARIQGMVVHEPLLWRSAGWARLEVSVAGYESGQGEQAQASSVLMPVAPVDEVHALARHVLGRDIRSVPLTRTIRRARWLAPLSAWTLALGQDGELLVSRRGFWVRRLDVVPPGRVQSVRLAQGPLRRRLGLADVLVDSPPGPAHVRGPLREAEDALAYLTQAVETCRFARSAAKSGQASLALTPPRPDTTQ
jgi:putative membrane protein